MFYLIYNLLFWIFLVLGFPFLLFRLLTTRRFRTGLKERLAIYGKKGINSSPDHSLWVQAASVGEVTAALPLLRLLREELPDYPLVLTCQTAAGRKIARKRLGSQAKVLLCPLDAALFVNRFFRWARPRILIMIETELWPGLITAADRRNIPILMVNGRISPRAFRGYMKGRFFLKPFLARITAFNMRSSADAHRIKRMGAPQEKISVTGNIKFDTLPAGEQPAREREGWKRILKLREGEEIVVGGSTFAGEEAILSRVFAAISPEMPRLRLILAPRHLNRIEEVERYLRSRKQPYALLGELRAGRADPEVKIVIVDQLGILIKIYAVAAVVFIGRSLSGVGGQNPIEPASLGKPIIFGPHMENFRIEARALLESGAALRVKDEEELKNKLREVLGDVDLSRGMGEAGIRVVDNFRGASRRNLASIKKLLGREE